LHETDAAADTQPASVIAPVHTITPEQAQDLIILDVRTQEEFDQEHIPNDEQADNHFTLCIERQIHDALPMFIFTLAGTVERCKYYGVNEYTNVHSITITCENDSFRQEIVGLNTQTPAHSRNVYMPKPPATAETLYGLSFDDWNFDGYTDISLWRYRGGSAENSPSYYWLWDNEVGQFVANEELEALSWETTLWANEESNQVISVTRYSLGIYSRGFYEYTDGGFVLVKTEQINPWNRPYADFLQNKYNNEPKTRFAVHDINGRGFPALILLDLMDSSDETFNKITVYTYIDNEVVKSGEVWTRFGTVNISDHRACPGLFVIAGSTSVVDKYITVDWNGLLEVTDIVIYDPDRGFVLNDISENIIREWADMGSLYFDMGAEVLIKETLLEQYGIDVNARRVEQATERALPTYTLEELTHGQ
jgi:rhodanese-related sulfurtransferase